MSRALRIAIVGGGVGGLAAACALKLRGHEAVVYERNSELKEVGAGLQIGPNGVRVLNALGFAEELTSFSCEPPDLVSVNWNDGSTRVREPLGRNAEQRFGAKYLMAHRADLYALMVNRLADGTVRLGSHCVDLGGRNGTAFARFESGEEIEADVVIAADGVRSSARQALFGADTPRYTGQIGWRAMLPMSDVPEGLGPDGSLSLRKDFVGWLGPRGHVIMYPIRSGEVLNFFAGYFLDEWAEESWTAPSTPEEMIQTFHGWNDALLKMMSKVGSVYKWGLFDRDPLQAMTKGRVALLGDAAHPMMPTLAQGASICIEDAWTIARHLDQGADDPERALKAYEAERLPRATRVQLQARQQYLNNKSQPSPPPISRDWIFRFDATTGQDWRPADAA
ncbi:MAG: salicylate 1-monooxygenase [Hyphomicrobiales bacterium]|nr:salicylate 1-monooxygenase [Hyphomicrobiales bacterium]